MSGPRIESVTVEGTFSDENDREFIARVRFSSGRPGQFYGPAERCVQPEDPVPMSSSGEWADSGAPLTEEEVTRLIDDNKHVMSALDEKVPEAIEDEHHSYEEYKYEEMRDRQMEEEYERENG